MGQRMENRWELLAEFTVLLLVDNCPVHLFFARGIQPNYKLLPIKWSVFQGKAEEALKAFEILVNKYPQSPRARYGKAQVKIEQVVYRKTNYLIFHVTIKKCSQDLFHWRYKQISIMENIL